MFSLVMSFQRYGGISVGGVNSQVRLTEEGIESVISDLQDLFASYQVCKQCFINITSIKIIVHKLQKQINYIVNLFSLQSNSTDVPKPTAADRASVNVVLNRHSLVFLNIFLDNHHEIKRFASKLVHADRKYILYWSLLPANHRVKVLFCHLNLQK